MEISWKSCVQCLGGALAGSTMAIAGTAYANEHLAKQTQNPVAMLVQVPFQLDYSDNLGEDDKGHSWNLKMEPVIPFRLTDDWNVISRTIVSLSKINDVPDGSGTDFGIGDTSQAFNFSPSAKTTV